MSMQANAVRFAVAVEAVSRSARRQRLAVPGFRSPPRLEGASRSIRWSASGRATIAVVIRDRPWPAVLADIVEGVVAANRLEGASADRCRAALWDALDQIEVAAA
jgi:hypothetical protein